MFPLVLIYISVVFNLWEDLFFHWFCYPNVVLIFVIFLLGFAYKRWHRIETQRQCQLRALPDHSFSTIRVYLLWKQKIGVRNSTGSRTSSSHRLHKKVLNLWKQCCVDLHIVCIACLAYWLPPLYHTLHTNPIQVYGRHTFHNFY